LYTTSKDTCNMYSVSQKIPPAVFLDFFLNGWEFLINIYTPNMCFYLR